MRSNSLVIIFGVVAVGTSILILAFSGLDEPRGPMTPVDHGRRLYRVQGCYSCHAIGGGISRGPDLAGLIPKLKQRLTTPAYQKHLAGLKRQRPDVYKTFEEKYASILGLEGDDRIRAWLISHLENPRFDHFMGKMPGFAHLTTQQIEQLTAFLFTLQ